jgi:hypothetical protein
MKIVLTSILTLLLFTLGSPAFALDFNIQEQAQFDQIAREAGTFITYRALAPAEPGGLTGFDISVAVSAVKVDSDLWDLVTPNDSVSSDYFYVPSIRVRKGLPFGIDVGASYAQVPGEDIKAIGGEVQWALLEGSVATPALALRGHYSTLLGVDDIDLTTYGADAVISKGFAIFTPYAGIGAVHMNGDYTNPLLPGVDFNEYDDTSMRYFGGLRMTLALLQVTADVEYLENPVYSLKVGLGW